MPTHCSATKPKVRASAFVEQQLYDFHLAAHGSALKPPARTSAFVKALQNQLFIPGGSGTHAIATNVKTVFQLIQNSSITRIPGANNFYFLFRGTHQFKK